MRGSHRRLPLGLALLFSALLLLVFSAAASAATIEVTRTDDPPAGTGDTCAPDAANRDCSLRHAIAAASSGDTVHVPGSANHYVLNSELVPTVSMFIVGDGAKSTIIDAQGNDRVFAVNNVTVVFRDLTMTNGNVEGDGGALFIEGTGGAQLTRVAVVQNHALEFGGGVANENTSGGSQLVIDHSEVSHNSTTQGNGGGIFTQGQGTAAPTVPVPAAQQFGRVPNNVDISNTTIANNETAQDGSGIYAQPPPGTTGTSEALNLLNDTIASNDSTFTGASLHASTGTGARGAGFSGTGSTQMLVQNTIIAQNTLLLQNNAVDNCGPVNIFSQDYNLADDNTCQFTNTHDQVVTDAKLGQLADNGGQTRTMALLEGSPAIDASDNNGCPADDQRGVSRPQRLACDTGAFELQAAGPSADMAITKTASPSSVNVGQTVTFTLTSTNNGPNDATNTVVTDTLPNGVAFVSDNPSQGSCAGTTTITCHLGTVATGAHATITIVARVTNAGQFVNSANVTADPADPNSANNHATATVIGVNPAAPSCVDTRKFTFELHKWHKTRIVDAVVFINGNEAGHRTGHDLKSITIQRLPQQVFLVKIVSTQATGSKLISRRTYDGCIKSRPKTTAFHIHPHHHHHHHHHHA